MAGKQSKKERKAQREAERERLRKEERRRTVFTGIVIGLVVVIGGVLIWISVDDPEPDLADLLDEGLLEDDLAEQDGAAEEGEVSDEVEGDPIVDDERPVACGAEVPPGAGEPKPTFDAPEGVLSDGLDYRAVIHTSCGQVVVELDAAQAPDAVNSFVFLAEHGFYDGLEIFRNAAGIGALQTGAGTNDASWQIGYTLVDELEWARDEGYPPGALAMANSGPDTAGSQFFFVYDGSFDSAIRAGGLQPAYTRFGTVVEGLDVLDEIGAIPRGGPRDETPQERVYLEHVEIVAGPAGATDDGDTGEGADEDDAGEDADGDTANEGS